MITIDLITGFLGAGKTTFIRKYATHLMEQGLNIGILENDHGAVNVDAMLLQDILGEHCTLEMVAGGCDADCHKRRFKTKLIAMGMCGYDRILVEPSGIFDMDEFFDVLHEDPLERWYTIGNVITIVDVSQPLPLSETSRYLLASQASEAGTIIFSHMDDANDAQVMAMKNYLFDTYHEIKIQTLPKQVIIDKPLDQLNDSDYKAIMTSGWHNAEYTKLWFDTDKSYDSLYFMNMDFSAEFLEESCPKLFQDPNCGNIFRIKGFHQLPDGSWLSVNATKNQTVLTPVPNGQAILIIIGEDLHQDVIERYWGRSYV